MCWKLEFLFKTINPFWILQPELEPQTPPQTPPTNRRQCACFVLRGRALDWCCRESWSWAELSHTEYGHLRAGCPGWTLLRSHILFLEKDFICYPTMRGGKKGAGRRLSGNASRRPSYPADPWINQAKTSTRVWVKVAMGIAYFLCVSVAAFFLAIYYVFFWTPEASNSTDAGKLNNRLDYGGNQTPAGK